MAEFDGGSNPTHHSDPPSKIIKLADDFISYLPDDILHIILSNIDAKFAIRTEVLSKRWENVWRETPSISIDCSGVDPSSINKTLRNLNPETLCLEFNAGEYTFQDFFFNYSSLKKLSIVAKGIFVLTPTCIVSWTSLRTLSLYHCNVSDKSIANILSGSPMLESLKLCLVYRLDHLDLSKSLRLTRLDISCYNYKPKLQEPMEIISPHIHYLRYKNFYRPVNLMDVSSLTEATLNRYDITYRFRHADLDISQDTMVEMLAKLQNIEKLTIGSNFLQILSFAELRGLPFPEFKIKDLTVKTRIIRSFIPGIVRLLQNSPELNKLTVHTKKRKTIMCENYLRMRGLNPDQCWSGKYGFDFPADDHDAKTKHVASLIQLLLQNAMTLETMVLRLDGYLSATKYQKLLPRVSSRNIKIIP